MEKEGISKNLIILFLILIIALVLFFIIRGMLGKSNTLTGDSPNLEIADVNGIDNALVSVTVKKNTEDKIDGVILTAYDNNGSEIAKENLTMEELERNNFQVDMDLTNISNTKKITLSTVSVSKSGKQTVGKVEDEYIFSESFGRVKISECALNEQCDDKVKCTTDSCSNGLCLHNKITSCTNNDNCCPTGCNNSVDNDCKSSPARDSGGSGGGGSGGGGSSGGGGGTTCTDTCNSLNYQCGSKTICGVDTNCGSCSSGFTCQTNGTCIKDACVPTTCNALERTCGSVSDGCNTTLNCGNCNSGYTCQANGTCIKDAVTDCGGVNCAAEEHCSNDVCLLNVSGNTYFVATNGNDNWAGDFTHPWLTWQKAFETAQAGDIVYIRGGVYYTTGTGINPPFSGYSGTASNLIRYYNYPGETPILDGIIRTTTGDGIAFLGASNIYFKGLTVRNNLQLRSDYGDNNGFVFSGGSNITLENCVSYNNGKRGFEFIQITNATVINCDSYNNCDNLRAGYPGGGGDGFFVQNDRASDYNSYVLFRGCRSWNNSDDGFDTWSEGRVAFENDWTFNNGYLDGDGNGFKFGFKYINTPLQPLDRRYVNCISAGNTFIGFTENNNNQKCINTEVYNNFAYDNDFGSFWSYASCTGSASDIYKNNVAYNSNTLTSGKMTASYNSWQTPPGVTLTNADFVSLDISQLMNPRKADGSLPDITFGHLAAGSDLINAGVNVNLPYNGAAPDLGPFESDY